MNNHMVSPLDLPIVPPMDLNATMPGIDRISPYPMQLRTRAGVGLFGTRRDTDPGLIRLHEGVDLLAPIGTKVFAAATGKVIGGSATSVLLLHDVGFRFLTFYQHLQNKTVQAGAAVNAGQQIAEVGDFPNSTEDHLHFEIRYPFDAANPSYESSLAVDPTMVLYQWEEKTYQNDDQVRRGHLLDNLDIRSIEESRTLDCCASSSSIWMVIHEICLSRSTGRGRRMFSWSRRSEVLFLAARRCASCGGSRNSSRVSRRLTPGPV